MAQPLKILGLEPWYGGSHARFLDGWTEHSAHRVEVLGLGARHWKWRMRSSAWELARRLSGRAVPDVALASDYVDLVQLRGFRPAALQDVPIVLYFHENQLTYPLAESDGPADVSYGFQNALSCLVADAVVFNSEYHRAEFSRAVDELCARLPHPNPRSELAELLGGARVIGPGVDLGEVPLGPGPDADAPLRVAFNHRWEHDKDPAAFLAIARGALRAGASIELELLGQRFAELPAGCAELIESLRSAVLGNEAADTRESYVRRLGRCDVVVSTAQHEFFGMAVLEGAAAGCLPLCPRRLSYPEVLSQPPLAAGLYDSQGALQERLLAAAQDPARLRGQAVRAERRSAVHRHDLRLTAEALDRLCESVTAERP